MKEWFCKSPWVPNTVWIYNLYRYALYNFSIATVVKIAMCKCRNGDGVLIKIVSDLSVGWDDSTTSQHLNKLARCAPSRNWRRIGFIRVQTTTLTQKWTRKSDGIHLTATQKYLIPLGMQKSLRRNYESQICKSWPVIPSNIKKSLKLTKENFRKEEITVQVTTCGNQGFQNLNHIFCQECKRSMLPEIARQHADHFSNIENPSIAELMDKWDNLSLSRNLQASTLQLDW